MCGRRWRFQTRFYIRYIAVDSLGRIWFASGDGSIYRYDNGDWQQLAI